MPHTLVFKILEIVLSMVFLVLCMKALCSHFYRDLRRMFHNRRQPIAFVRTSPPLVPAKVTARPKHTLC
jgi:hypothetical protein